MKFAIALVAAISVAEANYFKSGAVTGFEKFTYGKFITRMQAPDKKGTVSSFFTYWNGPDFYPGGWNELDVEIVPSVEKNPLSMNVIYGDGQTKREAHDYQTNFDPKNDWHIYEMAWTPDFIAYSIDNKEVRRITKDDPSVKFTSKPQSVMMNFWTPTFESWGKGIDIKDMPWYVKYDYIETYTYNSETKGFDFNWRDNFNTFDSNRWHKSDNTTFDANSTTFRASQSYIEDGNLVLKMEPDYLQPHGHHVHEPTHVEPVQTQPTQEGHQDVAAEQHHSYMERDGHHTVDPYGVPAFGVDQSYAPHYPYNPYGHGYYGEHADTYAEYYPVPPRHEDPYYPPHHADPYHHDQQQGKQQAPAQSKPSSQQKKPTKGQSKNDIADNFPIMYPVDSEQTPFEHTHALDPPHMKELVHGFEHHPEAHFEQGYWDLKDHMPHLYDHGHFSGEEHGEYHYVEPERDHHLGHYYSYGDEREHHPQHVDEHHDTHGIEHRPDDWKHEHETYYRHHDTYGYRPEHSYMGDFDLGHVRELEHFDRNFNHDVDYGQGTGVMSEIESSFDDLFQDLEHGTRHGVEHRDIHFASMHAAEPEPAYQHHYDYSHEQQAPKEHDFKKQEKSKKKEKKNMYEHEVHDYVKQMLESSSFAQ